jgi:hypothetical protein
MSGGEAFVIQAAAEIAMSERLARHVRPTTPERRKGGRLGSRSWIEILVAVGASLVMALMVAAGGVAATHTIADEALAGEPAMIKPDLLTSCRSVNGQMVCVREPT